VLLAVGLTPLLELSNMVGLERIYLPELGGFVPVHDENMMTSVNGLYVIGDIAGVEEASTAMEEGRLAGIDVAQRLGFTKQTSAEKDKDEARQRLAQLRGGPFGEARRRCKHAIVEAAQRCYRRVPDAGRLIV